MRRSKRNRGEEKVKKITVKKLQKRTAFVIKYGDGRIVETPYIEVMGPATLYLDPTSKEPTIRTEANLNLGYNGTCSICGDYNDDHHVHA